MKKLILSLLLLPAAWATAQYFPVGNGLPYDPGTYYTRTANDDSILVVSVSAPPNYQTDFFVWNNSFWTQLPSITNYGFVNEIEVFNGEVYANWQPIPNPVKPYHNLMVFRNGAWQNINPSGITGSGLGVMTVDQTNNRLVIGGNFDIPSISAENVVTYDGQNYNALPAIPSSFMPYWDSITDISIINNEIWLAGTFYFIDSLPAIKLTGGTTWDVPATSFTGATPGYPRGRAVFEYNNDAYVIDNDYQLFKIVGNTGNNLGTHYMASGFAKRLSPNGDVYMRPNAVYGQVYKFDGSTFNPFVTPGDVYDLGFRDSTIYCFPIDDTIGGIVYNWAARIIDQTAILNGTAFIDADGDCIYGSSESSIQGVLVQLGNTQSPSSNTSNSAGQYNIAIPAGTYPLSSIVPLNAIYKNIQPSCSLPSSFALSAGQTLQTDLAFSHNQNLDLAVLLTAWGGWRHRHGFTENYNLKVSNPGLAISNLVTVDLEIPSNLSLAQASPQANSVNGNIYTWHFNGLNTLEEQTINLQISSNVNTSNLGDTIIFNSTVSGISNDADTTDNRNTLIQIIRGAFDPNDKQVSDEFIYPGTNKIDYQIRFQNTGNDTAYRVVVVDTMDLTLPINKVIMHAASHSYSISAQNNVLIWEFDNILLPDSNTNLAASQGYIRFSSELDPSLGVGDSIVNSAQIYFDYQHPIYTNIAKTLIIENIGINEKELTVFQVFPNPSSERLMINNPASESISLSLKDSNGRLVKEIGLKAYQKAIIDMANYPAGIYLLHGKHQTVKILHKP